MNLLPPRIKGPVSECCSHIWVQGQFPGATVEVVDVDTGAVVGSDVVSSADAVIGVTGSLTAGDSLAARQALGADASGLAAETVEVQTVPADVGTGVFREPVFQCARCLWIDGLVPGADVVVRQDGVELGKGHSHIGYARVHLSASLSNLPVTVEQEACGNTGPPRTAIGPLTPPAGDEQGDVLSPPDVESPLQGCRTRLTISSVLPGATVELERSGGPDGSSCFDRPSLWWGMTPPLAEGETIRARQSFLECEKFSLWSEPVVVGRLDPVPIPEIVGPLCHMGTTVRVCGLLAGARVRITVAPADHHGRFGGETYEATAPEDGCFNFVLEEPGLPSHSVVSVTQELCGRSSMPSREVEVDDQPEELPRPEVGDPLHTCSIAVPVSVLQPGSRVYVTADGIGVIGEAQVTDEEMDIVVRPALQAGWVISAYAIGCGRESERADPVEVTEIDELAPPEIRDPVHSCDREVVVTGVAPGAAVDIYVNGGWVGRAHAASDEVDVGIEIGELSEGDEIWAIQELCEVRSRPGPAVAVTRFDGVWELLRDEDGDVIEDKSDILAVHVALLPTHQILIFAGDQYTSDGQPIDNTRLMDSGPPWKVETITGIPSNANLFCAGHSMLADGTVLTGGGTESRPPTGLHGQAGTTAPGHWLGMRESLRSRLDAAGNWGWETQGPLVTARSSSVRSGFDIEETGGRWYPTLITLPDGKVLALGGHPLDGDVRHTNTSLEIYDPATRTWSFVGTVDYSNIPGEWEAGTRGGHSEYPRAHVLPEGTVFVASEMADGSVWKWQPGSDPLAWTQVAAANPSTDDNEYNGNPQPYTTVLLPLRHDYGFTPEVLMLGQKAAYTLNPESTMASWTATLPGRTYPGQPKRIYPLATLLPTGEVFVSGGTETTRDSTALLKPEIYDPETGAWRTVDEEAERVRNYHSSALLLPDGSVWHSGGNENCAPGLDTQDRTVEIFKPWYFCWSRPRIGVVTERVCQGETFAIETPDAARIDDVVIVRISSFTHAFNPDQRLLSLEFGQDPEDGALLRAEIPSAPGIAVVGYYLCFILDENRVPSTGRFIQVCRGSDSTPGDSGVGGAADLFREWLAEILRVAWPETLPDLPRPRLPIQGQFPRVHDDEPSAE